MYVYAVNAAIGRGHVVCPLYGGCPLLGVSIIHYRRFHCIQLHCCTACASTSTCTDIYMYTYVVG